MTGNGGTVLLLPGLDGTGQLFEPFRACAPGEWAIEIAAYPRDVPLGYDALAAAIELPRGPLMIVAESFAGPLALRIAARHPAHLVAVVLSATFVTPPVPRALATLPWTLLFRTTPPLGLLRHFFCGGSEELAIAMRASVASVEPSVLAHRLRAVLACDARPDLRACTVPLLYLAAAEDRVISRRCGEEIVALHPQAQLRRVPGPHLLLQANPAGAWDVIGNFMCTAA